MLEFFARTPRIGADHRSDGFCQMPSSLRFAIWYGNPQHSNLNCLASHGLRAIAEKSGFI